MTYSTTATVSPRHPVRALIEHPGSTASMLRSPEPAPGVWTTLADSTHATAAVLATGGGGIATLSCSALFAVSAALLAVEAVVVGPTVDSVVAVFFFFFFNNPMFPSVFYAMARGLKLLACHHGIPHIIINLPALFHIAIIIKPMFLPRQLLEIHLCQSFRGG